MLTAHTLDDQAETVLIRLTRGSGVSGLAAMARAALRGAKRRSSLVRPLLDIAKVRLVATLHAARIAFADDPSNRDPRFTRVRLRGLMPALAGEGLTADRLALLARRVRRADAAIEAVGRRRRRPSLRRAGGRSRGLSFSQPRASQALPAEIALRLLGRAIGRTGDEGPVELGKLEALHAAFADASNSARFRRTLAGAVITLAGERIVVERAPARRGRARKRP